MTVCIIIWASPGTVWVVMMATSMKILACYPCAFQLEDKMEKVRKKDYVRNASCNILAVEIILFFSWISACLGGHIVPQGLTSWQ